MLQPSRCQQQSSLVSLSVCQRVEHHEIVDNALEAHSRNGNACFAKLIRIGLSFITKHIGFTGDNQGFRQTAKLVQTGAQREAVICARSSGSVVY